MAPATISQVPPWGTLSVALTMIPQELPAEMLSRAPTMMSLVPPEPALCMAPMPILLALPAEISSTEPSMSLRMQLAESSSL